MAEAPTRLGLPKPGTVAGTPGTRRGRDTMATEARQALPTEVQGKEAAQGMLKTEKLLQMINPTRLSFEVFSLGKTLDLVFGPTFFLTFGPNFFPDQILFGTNIFFGPKFLLGPKFFFF